MPYCNCYFRGGNLKAQEASVDFITSDDGKTLTISGQGDLTEASDFLTDLKSHLENEPETVKFKNTGSTPLYVNSTILRAFFFISNVSYTPDNKFAKVLDFGETTCKEFSEETFFGANAWPQPANFVLETLVLPLTEDKVVPSHVVSKFAEARYSLKTIVVPEGYEELGENSFTFSNYGNYQGVNGKAFSLPSSLLKIGDFAFKNCDLTEITLPDNLTTIGKQAFEGTSLKEINFPASLDKIDDGAFADVKTLVNLKFNEKLRFIGNYAFGLNSSLPQSTLIIPASVKYIGPGAFNNREYQDVYFQGTTAPLMPNGKSPLNTQLGDENTAFSGHVLMGNNGFELKGKEEGTTTDDPLNEGFANRENYRGSGGQLFIILHYPANLTQEQEATYTDITKKYWAKTDGWSKEYFANYPETVGEEPTPLTGFNAVASKDVYSGYQDTYVCSDYIWPSQSQWMRAYITAYNGVCWDGVTPYRTDLSEEELAVLKEAGYNLAETANHDNGEYTLDELQKIAHLGTRMFVLANGDSKSTPKYEINIKSGEWWTLCVPFNMTKKQVLDTFGKDTKLCLFNKVQRLIDVNNKNHISLYFTQDVLKHSSTKDGVKAKGEDGEWDYAYMNDDIVDVQDDDIVLWAHESYMIKPDGGENSNKDAVFVVENYEPIEGNPLPTLVHAVTKSDLQQDDDYTKEYRFIGNYLGSGNSSQERAMQVKIPQYSYVYCTTKKDPTSKFRFYTGTTSIWKPNKSIVQTNNRGGGLVDYNSFFGGEQATLPSSNAKQTSIFGDEDFGDVTGIDDITIIAGSDVLSPIYSLEGKLVRANGNVEGLPKGVYIQAGKKFVVK